MLVLSRKPGERVIIADQVEITILSIQGDRVRLGFAAPCEVSINRSEIQQRIENDVNAPRSTSSKSVANSPLAAAIGVD